MVASCTKDESLGKLDALMKPFETPPESFTIQDLMDRYLVDMNKAHKIVRKLVDAGQITRVRKNCYLISQARPADGTGPKSQPTRRPTKKRRGAR